MGREYHGEVIPWGGVSMGKGHHREGEYTQGADTMKRGHHGEGTPRGVGTHMEVTSRGEDIMGRGYA